MQEEKIEKTTNQKQNKFMKRSLIALAVIGSIYAVDKLDIPSKLLNSYSNVKEKLFSNYEENKINREYKSASELFSELPDTMKGRMLSEYLIKHPQSVSSIVDKFQPNQADSFVYYAGSNPKFSQSQKVEWIGNLYDGMSTSGRWKAFKEVTKSSFGLR